MKLRLWRSKQPTGEGYSAVTSGLLGMEYLPRKISKTAGAFNQGSGKGGGFHTFEFENGLLLVKNALRMKFVCRSKKRL